MPSAKSTIRQQSLDLVLDLFSLHENDFEGFFAGLLRALNNKNLKVQTSAVSALNALMAAFGLKLVPFKLFVGSVEKYAAVSNPQLRGEALNFYKECYRWAREGILPIVDKLKKAQQDELKRAFEDLNEPAVPTRRLKCDEGKQLSSSSKPVDVYEMTEASDIFSKYNERWADRVFAMEKWAEKKEALQELNQQASCGKLAQKNALPLVTLAKRLMGDSNLQVVLQAIKLVGLLARGQRRFFDNYAKQFFPLLVHKFRDKKAQVIQEAHTALDSLLFSIPLEACLEDVKVALEDKTPSVKINVCQWLMRAVAAGEQVDKIAVRVVPLLKKNTEDSVVDVRNASLELLGGLLQKCPEVVRPAIADLSKAKIQKLGSFGVEEVKEAKPTAKAKVAKPPLPSKTEQDTPSQDLDQIMKDLLPEGIVANSKDPNWKNKLQGLSDLQDWICEHPQETDSQGANLSRFISSITRDWKENNFNVTKQAAEILITVINGSSDPQRLADLILTASLSQKLSESKLVETVGSLFTTLCERAGPKKPVGFLVKIITESGKPKIISESTALVSSLVRNFGVLAIPLKNLIACGKHCLSQSNPAIKKAGQTLLCALYSQIGPPLLPQLSDLKDSTLRALQQDFKKTPVSAIQEALIPPSNISAHLTPELLAKLAHVNWLTRKEALEELDKLIGQGRLHPQGLDSLLKALKPRLNDANKALTRLSISLVGRLADSLGPEAPRFARLVVPPLLSNLGDKQQMLRQQAQAAVQKWGPEAILSQAPDFLSQENPEIRNLLLTMILDNREALRASDVKQLVQGVLQCLQDRSAQIRGLAEDLFSEVVSITGLEVFNAHLTDVKPAVIAGLKKVFEKFVPESSIRSKSPTISKRSSPSPVPVAKMRSFSREPKSPIVTKTKQDFSIVSVGNKAKRLEADVRARWSVDELRAEYVLKLREQSRLCFSADLHALLFSVDFKKQAEGASQIGALMAQQPLESIELIDLILKWVWTRLTDSNTQLLKGVLELCQSLVKVLESEGYFLNETEASLFLPILCEKSGNNNQQFQTTIRTIIMDSVRIYPADRVLAYLVQGLASKNAKSRVECLKIVSMLVQTTGAAPKDNKDIKAIVKMVDSSEGTVRQAALEAMAEVYKLRGAKVWEMVGEVSDKVRGMLDQKFKTQGSKIPSRPSSRSPAPASKVLKFTYEEERREGRKGSLNIEESPHKGLKVPETFLQKPGPPERSHFLQPRNSSLKTQQKPNPFQQQDNIPLLDSLNMSIENSINESLLYEPLQFEVPFTELDKFIEVLKVEQMSSKVDALVSINDMIVNRLDVHAQELQAKSDKLIGAFVSVLVSVFDRPVDEIPLRFAKYFLSVVTKISATRLVVKSLGEDCLSNFLDQLNCKLMIDKLERLGSNNEGEGLKNSLNTIVLKVLENAEPTSMFVVLLRLLQKYTPSHPSMRGLIVKSLLKVTKVMSAGSLRVDRILQEIHAYLSEHRPDDVVATPFKLIVSELVKQCGDNIWAHYDPVKGHAVLKRWIEELSVNPQVIKPTQNFGSKDPILVGVFRRLQDPNHYEFALKDLHKYIEEKPELDLSPFLAGCSTALFERITEDLRKMREEGRAGVVDEGTINFQDFQNRLVLIKQRYGMAPSQRAPAQVHSTLSELKAKVNSLLSKANSLQEQTDLISEVKSRIDTLNRA